MTDAAPHRPATEADEAALPRLTPAHRIRRMSGRDPHEANRVATPLELLFDLTFVISVGVAASQLAHALAAGHVVAGVVSFGITTFAVCWAWINFSWFASAYDTDDWIYRLATMLQMVGVIILAMRQLPDRPLADVQEAGHLLDGVVLLVEYGAAAAFDSTRACGLSHL